MFVTKCMQIIFILIFLHFCENSAEDDDSNSHLMKDEISKALLECGETKEDRKIAKAEFERRSGSPSDKTKKYFVKSDVIKKSDDNMSLREKRNIYGMLEELRKFLKEETLDDSNSGEWDYGDSKKGHGQYWNDQKDDTANVDSIYNHERRNSSSRNNNNNYNQNTRSGYGRSLQDQNSTRYDQNDQSNNFNSRGGRFSPGFRKLMDDRMFRSVKDLNMTTNYYDPFMTRGIRSADSSTLRKKRNGKLAQHISDNECLSQCVFTNLLIVDERGIPKEALFIRLLQDSVASQQSRVLLESQVKSCFRELTPEAEENGCAYSNTLEKCMGLQLRKRKSEINEDTSAEKN